MANLRHRKPSSAVDTDDEAATDLRASVTPPKIDSGGLGLHMVAKEARARPKSSADGVAIRRYIHRTPTSMDMLPRHDHEKFAKKDIELPAHGRRESLLYSQSDFTDFRGFINLGMLCLFFVSFRVALENLDDYGVLVDLWPLVSCLSPLPLTVSKITFVSLNWYILCTLVVEKVASGIKKENRWGMMFMDGIHVLNITMCLGVTCAVMVITKPPVVGAFICVFQCLVVTMKLVSYVAVNQHYRTRMASTPAVRRKKPHQPTITAAIGVNGSSSLSPLASSVAGPVANVKRYQRERTESINSESESEPAAANGTVSKRVRYPDNVNLSDMYYFIAAPTLCYELNFPRTPSIRKMFAIRRATECVVIGLFIVFLTQQWMIPLVENTLAKIDVYEFSQPNDLLAKLFFMFQRTLKLALPNNLIWLLLFYMYFHAWMNLVAELLRFGDRQFYRDWWNAHSVQYFWRNWNIPVHKWMQRHVYLPMRANNIPKPIAILTVFGLSAVLHEVLFSISLGVFKCYSFVGMIIYVPLAYFTDFLYKNTRMTKTWGNVIVWCSIVLGQPMGIVLYAQGVDAMRKSAQAAGLL
eukprot:m.209253 g.209253  ORF g.209253 m.209253 type:complete len:582 (-) comp18972_c0_seq1:384-2129(-)